MLLIARKTINSVGAEFLTVLPDHSFFVKLRKLTIFLGLQDSVIVGDNGKNLTQLNKWLSLVIRSVNSRWIRCWHASEDGWAGSTFHSRCDGKGPTVTIVRVGKYIFGGYTSVSWYGKLTM